MKLNADHHTSVDFPRFELFFIKHYTLFINKRFALNEMFQGNASKFAIFYIGVYENPKFSFRATLLFPLMNALVYVDIDQGIYMVKI